MLSRVLVRNVSFAQEITSVVWCFGEFGTILLLGASWGHERWGYIDVGVENLDPDFEETAIDNAPDKSDVDENKIPRGKSIFSSISTINRGIEEDWK